MIKSLVAETGFLDRRHFVGGLDARIIKVPDEAGLVRLLAAQAMRH